jgi:hypothetical protein
VGDLCGVKQAACYHRTAVKENNCQARFRVCKSQPRHPEALLALGSQAPIARVILFSQPHCFAPATRAATPCAQYCPKSLAVIACLPSWRDLARAATFETGLSPVVAERAFFPYLSARHQDSLKSHRLINQSQEIVVGFCLISLVIQLV